MTIWADLITLLPSNVLTVSNISLFGKAVGPELYRIHDEMAAKKAPAKAMTKTEILNVLAEKTGVQKKDVSNILEELGTLIGQNLKKSGPGVFNVPGLMKIVVQDKPAKKARKGINPFTDEEMMFKAKPATRVVKIRPLKGLKDMV